jgi:hypothetical protein
VAQGLTNPDIAQQLVLSEHTVHRHLANTLRKLSLCSRATAAAWGVRTRGSPENSERPRCNRRPPRLPTAQWRTERAARCDTLIA